MLKAGATMEDVQWTTSQGESYRLSDLTEHKAVIVFFYPGDFTPGCTKEVCHFRDIYSELEEAGAVLFGVSLDDDRSHEKFRDQHSLPYALIADNDKSLSRSFGVLRLGGLLKVRRATFVINPRTKQVVDSFSNEFNMSVHGDRVLDRLNNWNEGE